MSETLTEHMRNRLMAGVDTSAVGDKAETLDSLRRSECSEEFERLRSNRMVVGRFRYGRFDRTSATNYDRVGEAIGRLKAYRDSGNLEHLVDVANFCALEFAHSAHPNAHFDASDDAGHAKRTQEE